MKILEETLEFLIRRHEQACMQLHYAEKAAYQSKSLEYRTKINKVMRCEHECEFLEHLISEVEQELGE